MCDENERGTATFINSTVLKFINYHQNNELLLSDSLPWNKVSSFIERIYLLNDIVRRVRAILTRYFVDASVQTIVWKNEFCT